MFASPADIGSNNSGYYDLQAVLTHQGRSSSSGHYVGWVKRKEGKHSCFTMQCIQHVVCPESIEEPNPKCTQMVRNFMFLLSPVVSASVRWVVQVWRWQSECGVSRGYLATVWRRRLAYSIRSTVRPPAAGNTWRGTVAVKDFLEDDIQHAYNLPFPSTVCIDVQ